MNVISNEGGLYGLRYIGYGIKVHFREYNGLIAAVREWLKNKSIAFLAKV